MFDNNLPAQPVLPPQPPSQTVSSVPADQNIYEFSGVSADVAPLGVVYNLSNYVLNQPPTKTAPPGFNNAFVYFLQVKHDKTGVAGMSILVHHQVYSEEELAKMLQKAIDTTVECKVKARRKGAVITPGIDLVAINRQHFEGDMRFIEAVMCDKFDFRVIKPTSASGTIEATARLAAQEQHANHP